MARFRRLIGAPGTCSPASRLTSSACRDRPVFMNTALSCERTVSGELPEIPASVWMVPPLAMPRATRDSAGVRSNSPSMMSADGTSRRVTGVISRTAEAEKKMSRAASRTGTRCAIIGGCPSRAASGIERIDRARPSDKTSASSASAPGSLKATRLLPSRITSGISASNNRFAAAMRCDSDSTAPGRPTRPSISVAACARSSSSRPDRTAARARCGRSASSLSTAAWSKGPSS